MPSSRAFDFFAGFSLFPPSHHQTCAAALDVQRSPLGQNATVVVESVSLQQINTDALLDVAICVPLQGDKRRVNGGQKTRVGFFVMRRNNDLDLGNGCLDQSRDLAVQDSQQILLPVFVPALALDLDERFARAVVEALDILGVE